MSDYQTVVVKEIKADKKEEFDAQVISIPYPHRTLVQKVAS